MWFSPAIGPHFMSCHGAIRRPLKPGRNDAGVSNSCDGNNDGLNFRKISTHFVIDCSTAKGDSVFWYSWWRHQIETFSALLALCEGNSPVTGEFPSQRPVRRSFAAFFDLRLNKRLSKQSICLWFETPSRSLWRHCNVKGWPRACHFLAVWSA